MKKLRRFTWIESKQAREYEKGKTLINYWRILGQLYDEVLLTVDRRYDQYQANEDRINLNDALVFAIFQGKLVASNTKKYSHPDSLLMYCGTCTENLVGILESARQKMDTERSSISEKDN